MNFTNKKNILQIRNIQAITKKKSNKMCFQIYSLLGKKCGRNSFYGESDMQLL